MKMWKIAQHFDSIPEHKPGLAGKEEREARLVKAINQFAEDNNIGPIRPVSVDSRGEITLVQEAKNAEYVNPNPIDPKILDTAKEYGLISNRSGSRWICMNHFAWEKMLGDMGYFSRATPEELSAEFGE
jgi:hypothetical protein